MEVIIVVGGVDGDVRLRLILVAARFLGFWKSWIVSTSPLPLDQQEVVVVCALEQDSLCGRLPPPQLRRASKQVESTGTLLSHPNLTRRQTPRLLPTTS